MNNCQKLDDQDIEDIKQALARGERGADLARQYGVTTPVISQIKSGVRKPNGRPVAKMVCLTIEEAKALLDSYYAMVSVAKQHLGGSLHPLVDTPKKHFGGMLEKRIAQAEGEK